MPKHVLVGKSIRVQVEYKINIKYYLIAYNVTLNSFNLLFLALVTGNTQFTHKNDK